PRSAGPNCTARRTRAAGRRPPGTTTGERAAVAVPPTCPSPPGSRPPTAPCVPWPTCPRPPSTSRSTTRSTAAGSPWPARVPPRPSSPASTAWPATAPPPPRSSSTPTRGRCSTSPRETTTGSPAATEPPAVSTPSASLAPATTPPPAWVPPTAPEPSRHGGGGPGGTALDATDWLLYYRNQPVATCEWRRRRGPPRGAR